MAKVHLIGTLHTDLHGAKRLEKALYLERPDIITLETSPERNGSHRYWTKNYHIFLEKLEEFLKQKGVDQKAIYLFKNCPYLALGPYEPEICLQYSQKQKIPLFTTDTAITQAENIDVYCRAYAGTSPLGPNASSAKLTEILTNIVQNAQKTFDVDAVYNQYATLQKYYEDNIPVKSSEDNDDGLIGKRDECMANAIFVTNQIYPSAKIIHVGGARHNLNDPLGETLYERLRRGGLNPTRSTLVAYE